MKREDITKNHIQEWNDIKAKADDLARDARDEFNSMATWIPIGAGAGLAIISAMSAGVVPALILGSGTLIAMSEAHVRSYRQEHYYKSYSEFARLNKRQIEKQEISPIGFAPDFEEEKISFESEYKKPNLLTCFFNPRATIIAVSVCAGASAVAPDNAYQQAVTWFNGRNESEENNPTGSDLAPVSSVRPAPRP